MGFSRGGATILVVQADPVLGGSVADLLRREGHVVHHAADGREAVSLLRSVGEGLDLLICDLLLPEISGRDVVRELAALGLSAPVLVMTGIYGSEEEVRSLRDLGVAGYVHASAPFEHLLFRVNNLLYPCRDDQRGDHRVAVSVPVRWEVGERVHYGTSYNLSVSGVYVRTGEPVVVGSLVDLWLSLPTARQMVELTAEIVHSATPKEVQGTAYPAGFGSRFVDVSPLGRAAIRAFVRVVHEEESLGKGLGSPRFELVAEEEPVAVG